MCDRAPAAPDPAAMGTHEGRVGWADSAECDEVESQPFVVTPAKAGVHGPLDPRLRGGDDMGAF